LILRRHFPVLDGLRGVAIIAVLFRHSAYIFQAHGPLTRWFVPILQFGNWGVDLFFVLSGFLITGILMDTREALNRELSFYGRRILRIFPVYYLALFFFLLLEHYSPWAKMALNLESRADHWCYLLYFQNWLPLWHHGDYPESIISHFWSLAVEEQFYLVWPAIVWYLSPRAIIRLCAIALAAVFLARLGLVVHYGTGIWVYADDYPGRRTLCGIGSGSDVCPLWTSVQPRAWRPGRSRSCGVGRNRCPGTGPATLAYGLLHVDTRHTGSGARKRGSRGGQPAI